MSTVIFPKQKLIERLIKTHRASVMPGFPAWPFTSRGTIQGYLQVLTYVYISIKDSEQICSFIFQSFYFSSSEQSCFYHILFLVWKKRRWWMWTFWFSTTWLSIWTSYSVSIDTLIFLELGFFFFLLSFFITHRMVTFPLLRPFPCLLCLT